MKDEKNLAFLQFLMQPELHDLKISQWPLSSTREREIHLEVGVGMDLGFSKRQAEYFCFETNLFLKN